jgi:mercuric ion transport protein
MKKNTNCESVHLSEEPVFQESEGAKSVTEPASIASLGGIFAAFFASLCCIGPVVFGALGVGVGATGFLANTAGFLKVLVPYRPFFIIVAMVAIGTGFYLVYRKPGVACASDSPCSHSRTRSKSVFFLWLATALTLLFVLSPYWLDMFK